MKESLKHPIFHELARDLLLAEKNYDRKLNSYLKNSNPTRRRETTLYAQRITASEWLGKCEDELEKYINERIYNGVFSFSYLPQSKKD